LRELNELRPGHPLFVTWPAFIRLSFNNELRFLIVDSICSFERLGRWLHEDRFLDFVRAVLGIDAT
jgi:hypothetical protein